MSHVVPDLVQKVLKGQDPLHILGDGSQVRHYTYGGDLAAGIVTAMEHPDALNEDFNLSTATSTTVLELAETIWKKVRGRKSSSATRSTLPSSTMLRCRIPATEKAAKVLGVRGDDVAERNARRGDPMDQLRRGRGSIWRDRTARCERAGSCPVAPGDVARRAHRGTRPRDGLDLRVRRPGRRRADVMATTGAMLSGRHTYEVGRRSKRPEVGRRLRWRLGRCRVRADAPGQDAGRRCLPSSSSPAVWRTPWRWGFAAADGKTLEVPGTTTSPRNASPSDWSTRSTSTSCRSCSAPGCRLLPHRRHDTRPTRSQCSLRATDQSRACVSGWTRAERGSRPDGHPLCAGEHNSVLRRAAALIPAPSGRRRSRGSPTVAPELVRTEQALGARRADGAEVGGADELGVE